MSSKRSAYFLIAILAIIWGSSFILMKRGLVVYTPYQVGAIRITIAAIALFPFIVRHFKTVPKANWKFLAASGFFGNGIPAMLFPLAETRISSGLAGMMNSLTPVFTLLLGVIWFGMKANAGRIAGIIVGLIGAIILINGNHPGNFFNDDSSYALLVVLATVCYAISVNVLRYKLFGMEPVMITGFALMTAGVPMSIYLFSTDFIARTVSSPDAAFSLTCILILGLFSTAISTVLFNRLIKISGALSASSVTYLIPIVATMWGFVDNEKLGWIHLAGLVSVLAGIYLINKKSKSEVGK